MMTLEDVKLIKVIIQRFEDEGRLVANEMTLEDVKLIKAALDSYEEEE